MSETIEEAAARWYAAQDGDDMDWDGFTAWLEGDARHRAAFDAVALLGDRIAAQRPALAAAFAPPRPATRRWVWAGVGSTLAAALAVAAVIPREAADTVWASGPAPRTVALADGVTTTLAPRSRLTAIAGDAARLALSGEAYFDVRHQPGRTLSIRTDGYTVTDIGTRFTVAADRAATRVAVAEGQVSVAGSTLAAPVALAAGRAFTATAAGVRLSPVAAADVGSWRRGTLSYADAPLALVAADIARYSGRAVTVDPAIEGRRLTGTLSIGDGSGLADAVGAILDLDVRRDGDGVRLQPRR